tara:strand:+ start:732 stop:1025 length:294 start_codon:yes stop_codon:yes gene_type:complete
MITYKLKYNTEAAAIKDFKSKGIINDEGFYTDEIAGIVFFNKITELKATKTKKAKFYKGVFYDLLSVNEYDFKNNRIYPSKSIHVFNGYDLPEQHKA